MDNKDLIKVATKVLHGNAILFTGAGFSMNTTNISKKEPPLARDLSHQICQLMPGFVKDDDLMYVSDYYIKNNHDINMLIKLLKKNFTIKSIGKEHEDICKLNWKRIYTTNYDNSIKLAYTKNNRSLQTISANDSESKNFNKDESLCIHINGQINNLTKNTLNTTFKLSDSSYMSPESFVNSFWYRQFKRDAERAGALVFIGYSLYDLDIKKILFENEVYKEKTYFIIREGASQKEIFQLEQYGKVFPIGLKGVTEIFNEELNKYTPIEDEFYTESFIQYEQKSSGIDILDKNIENFFQYGEIDINQIYQAILAKQKKKFLIIRKELESVKGILKHYPYVFITADFGNGKTIFLQELMASYSIENKDIFYLKNFDSNYLTDIEKLNALNREIYLFIDGYAQCLDIFDFLSDNNFNNLKFIFSERSTVHNGLRKDILDESKSIEVSIDRISNDEVMEFIDIIDSIGYWGEKSNYSEHKKIEIISKNNNELSLNLLSLFDSNHIKSKLKSIVTNIRDPEYKNTLFAICLLEAIGVEMDQSLISEVACSNKIYEDAFKYNENISQLFKFQGNELLSKSSLFSLYMLQNTFQANYTIERLIILSEKFNELQNDNFINKEIFRYLLRFNFVQRILPKDNQNSSLIQYYEKLKNTMNWLTRDIHYWLQYGMCRIALGEYSTAQKYLDTAYSFATQRDGYDTYYIDSQQSRLYLIQAEETHIAQESYKLFEQAHYIILTLPDDGYKFKRVKSYYDIYKKHFQKFSKKNKLGFIQVCENMLDTVKNMPRDKNYESYSVNKIYDISQNYLEIICSSTK
jgi:hypothetical protein